MSRRADRAAEWLTLMRTRLPEAAEDRDWPIRLDHCFGRVIYDNVLGHRWDRVLTEDAPAYEQMTDDRLDDCVRMAHAILNGPDQLLHALNDRSLAYRGELNGPAAEIPASQDPRSLSHVEQIIIKDGQQASLEYYSEDGTADVIITRSTEPANDREAGEGGDD